MSKRAQQRQVTKLVPSAQAKPIYESNRKHKEPWQPGKKGSLCPKEAVLAAAKLLDESVEFDGARWAVKDGRAYKAKEHASNRWHGWPVGWVEVPATLRLRLVQKKLARKHDLKRYWYLTKQ